MSKQEFSAKRLLKLYDRVADAPDAVERLRRFVLDLAVRGKLVEQHKGDEAVGILLEQIAARKAQMARDGLIKKPKPYVAINNDELPIEIPQHWAWLRLRDIGGLAGGMTPSKNQPRYWDGDVVWLSPKDIKIDEATDSELKITSKGLSETRLQLFPPGSLFMVARSGILKRTFPVAINRVPAACNQDIKVLKPYLKGQERYLQIMLRGLTDFILSSLVKTGTTVQSLKYAEFEEQPFPIPPLAEQQRIVAKVDELMTLLDRLETIRTQRETTRNRLTTASLSRLTAPEPTEVDFPTHARFAFDNLDQLTMQPEQINVLQQTLLNLAVRGRLVEQDPADEPASELLSRMAAEANSSGSGHGRESKRLRDVDIADAPFELPPGWTWAHFPEIGQFGRGKSRHRPRNDPALYTGGSHLMIQTGDVARSEGRITTYTNKYNDVGLAQSLLWPKGTLCITIAANIADSGILDFDACFPDSVVGFVPDPVFKNARYFEYFVRTAKANLLEFAPATAQKNINLEILKSVLIPLPPLAEQQRIVAKVDSLLAMCGRLQTVKAQIDTTRSQLVQALLRDALEMRRSSFGLVTEVSQRPVGAL